MAGALTRSDLTEAVYREIGLSRTDSAMLVEQVLNEVIGNLEDGNPVKIAGFGSFSVRSKKDRIGRNPKTGEEVTIEPRRVLSFRASSMLKDRLNKY
ncbi:MAG: integration host factor subunit alpha [Alphaproteobacteria bacterium]